MTFTTRKPFAVRLAAFADLPGCWLWDGHTRAGYGRVTIQVDGKGTGKTTHRLAYELLVGPIPSGYDLDHLCKNTRCMNPAHLEPVTHRENMRRGRPAMKQRCKNGHPYTPENTKLQRNAYGVARVCRTCSREQGQERSRRFRERKHLMQARS